MESRTYVLYHAGCADGFASAWVVWLLLGDRATYLPVSYGRPMPEIDDWSHVYILDFSYAAAELRALAKRSQRVVVLDHHASAKGEILAVQDEMVAVYDSDHSGCLLTWQHFMGPDMVPGARDVLQLLRYVEDRDLWRWALPQSREVNAALATYPFDFVVWANLACDIGALMDEGKTALRAIDEEAKRVAGRARLHTIAGYTAPVVNCTSYYSEVSDHLLQLYPGSPFVATFRDGLGLRRWSLRSRPDFDCSEIAKLFGGGGHAQACGFETAIPDPTHGGISSGHLDSSTVPTREGEPE